LTEVILVDENDRAIGTMEKMEAHRRGILHRAFSIFIFNHAGQMLLQQRAAEKYHSGNLWTNACCSHPLPGEDNMEAAHRRLHEELGFDTALKHAFHFTYKTEFSNGLTEHEFDHVYIGYYDGMINALPSEVKAHCFMTMDDIRDELHKRPALYTDWFRIAFPLVVQFNERSA